MSIIENAVLTWSAEKLLENNKKLSDENKQLRNENVALKKTLHNILNKNENKENI